MCAQSTQPCRCTKLSMKIIGFVEGATLRKGGMGLVGVPTILASTAARGHHIALVMGGPPGTGMERFLVGDLKSAFRRREGDGTFGAVSVWATARWALAPAILWRARRDVSTADFVTLHSLYSFPVLAGYVLATLYRKPYGVWPHGVLAPFQRTVSAGTKWVYDKLFVNRILRHAAVIFYSAEGERDESKALTGDVNWAIVPDGIDVRRYSDLPARGLFRKRFALGERGPLILFLARLNRKKGLDLLLDAMAQVIHRRPDSQLAIVGPPDPPAFRGLVEEWITARGLQGKVHMMGGVTEAIKREALADADVFAMPSEAENFGFSVFEAMASGIPVVVSDTINYASEIAGSNAGYSVRRDAASVSDAILTLLDDGSRRELMGANGIALAKRYSQENTGELVEAAICEALTSARR